MPPRAATAGCGKCYEPDGGFRRAFPLYLLIEEKCESVSRESSESERVSVMQCERLVMLRKKFGLSQESMAERFHVSRQAVQKWENGSSVPDIERLIDIARFFNVSLDTLLREEDVRSVDELRPERDIVPRYQALTDWDLYSSTLRTEYRQSLEEGRDVARYQKVFESVAELSPDHYKEALADVLFNVVKDAPQREEYPYNEPSDLENIRKLRAKTDRTFHPAENLRNRLYGAWIGRISGCALGKPLEGIRRGELEKVLKATGNYPLHRHVRDGELTEEILGSVTYNLRGRCFADTLDFEPADDDTNYTVLGMKLIERHGRDFTPRISGLPCSRKTPTARRNGWPSVILSTAMHRLFPPSTKTLTGSGSARRYGRIISAMSTPAIPRRPQKWRGGTLPSRMSKTASMGRCWWQPCSRRRPAPGISGR